MQWMTSTFRKHSVFGKYVQIETRVDGIRLLYLYHYTLPLILFFGVQLLVLVSD